MRNQKKTETMYFFIDLFFCSISILKPEYPR